MATDYERLRVDVQAEIDKPGAITKNELRALLVRNPPQTPDDDFFGDDFFDPTFFE